MATWPEVLNDRAKYPDTMEVEMSGEKVKLGDLRNTVVPKADFTRHTQEASARERAAADQLAQAQAQLANAIARAGNPKPETADDLADYLSDPAFAPLAKRIKSLEDKLGTAHETLKAHEQQYWLGQHIAAIREIQAKDKDFQQPEKVQELLKTMQTHGLANVSTAHQLLTRERDLAAARTEAEKTGYEKGKAERDLPPIVTGRVPRREAGADVPAVFGRASEDAALRDPVIQKALVGAE